MNYSIATQSLVYLLNFIYEHNPNLVSKIQEPIFENMSDRLVLANHSLRQLNIIDDGNSGSGGSGGSGGGVASRLSSVLSLLNHTVTPMGSRAYKYTLLHPTFCVEDLEQDYAITAHILSLGTDDLNTIYLRERLTYIKDIEKLHRHIIIRKITPYHAYCLFHNLRHIRELYSACLRDSEIIRYLSERHGIQNDVWGKARFYWIYLRRP
jgi:DNA mismatch repair protein MutS